MFAGLSFALCFGSRWLMYVLLASSFLKCWRSRLCGLPVDLKIIVTRKNLVVKDLSELSMDSIHIFAISIYLRGCESCPKFNIRPCVRICPGLVLKRVAGWRVLFRCFNFKFSLSRTFFCTQRELFVVKMLIRLVSYLHNPVWGWLKVEYVAATDIFNSVISLT